MVALTADRNTKRRDGTQFSYPVDAAKTIYTGAMVVLAAGLAAAATTATGLVAVGVAEEFVDNSAGAASDLNVPVRKGVFHFANSAAADEIALDDVGGNCYIVDDQTVALTDGTSTRSVAGKIVDVDSTGVWVEFA
jgi:hypothetical protein